jgi:hypothetical protein
MQIVAAEPGILYRELTARVAKQFHDVSNTGSAVQRLIETKAIVRVQEPISGSYSCWLPEQVPHDTPPDRLVPYATNRGRPGKLLGKTATHTEPGEVQITIRLPCLDQSLTIDEFRLLYLEVIDTAQKLGMIK